MIFLAYFIINRAIALAPHTQKKSGGGNKNSGGSGWIHPSKSSNRANMGAYNQWELATAGGPSKLMVANWAGYGSRSKTDP